VNDLRGAKIRAGAAEQQADNVVQRYLDKCHSVSEAEGWSARGVNSIRNCIGSLVSGPVNPSYR
jgi:hypothetical protein